jgi:hypothetical protein
VMRMGCIRHLDMVNCNVSQLSCMTTSKLVASAPLRIAVQCDTCGLKGGVEDKHQYSTVDQINLVQRSSLRTPATA